MHILENLQRSRNTEKKKLKQLLFEFGAEFVKVPTIDQRTWMAMNTSKH